MVLYMIGLGLGDERDITVRGLEAVKSCKRVVLEAYTSILGVDKSALERFYEKEVEVADREFVEQGVDSMLDDAVHADVAFLVVGDPFAATTHTDLQLRAREKGVAVRAIHNASIVNAVAVCGLQLYRFGQTVSIVFFTETWRPDSFYDRIAENRALGLHTLCLLDIRVKEQSEEALCRGRREYEPPRYMSAALAAEQLLEVEERRGQKAYTADTMCVAVARIGHADQRIVAAPLRELATVDMGPPLHSLVVVGTMHPLEEDALRMFPLSRAGYSTE